MRSGAKGQARLNVQHLAAVCGVCVLPGGADQQLVAYRHGVKIFFPVIHPVLHGAQVRAQGVGDTGALQPLL